jgi:CO dehydrogenase/acetyl-CoA synthase gamma subunit (corrinoid Fe-S protein)
MAVKQEMAEIHPPEAEELSEFFPETDCGNCGFASCIQFAEAVLEKEASPQKCPDLDDEFVDRLTAIVELKKNPIPYNLMMEQVSCEIIEINSPDKESPLLITSNFQETVRIMREILEATSTEAFLLPTHTHGYSVDNAVHEKMFKAMEIWKAIKENEIEARVERPTMIIPGLAESEKNAIRQLTRWEVSVGPVSGFLAPLFISTNK